MTLRARSDRRFIRSTHRSERFVLVELEAPPSEAKHTREPINLAFVLDRSGSMSGQKIELAKKAVELAVDRLLPDDRFAVVVYDDEIDVVVESTNASREAKTNALEKLRRIDARGSTNLAGGWLRGAEQVALHLAATGVNRVLLLTDGLANVGIVDHDELTRHATELRARGIGTTTFGVGADFDEALLQSMADAGGGHFYYIERPEQIQDLVASEVGELLEVVAHEAAIEVTAPDGVRVEALSPYRSEQRGNVARFVLGDLVAEQRLEVVLRVRFGYGEVGREVGILVGVTDREGVLAPTVGFAPVPLGWEYADDPTNDAQQRDRSVDRRVAELFAARARQDAVKLNRLGDFEAAALGLRSVARRIEAYAGSDADLRALAKALRSEEATWSAPAPEMLRKQSFATASYAMRSRGPEGRAER